MSPQKDAAPPVSSGKCRWEQGGPTAHLSESGHGQHPGLASGEQQALAPAAGEAGCRSHFESQLGGFLQNRTDSYRTIQQSCSLECTQRGCKFMSSKTLHMIVYSLLIYNYGSHLDVLQRVKK